MKTIQSKMIIVFILIIIIPMAVVGFFQNKLFSKYTVSLRISNLNLSNEIINYNFNSFINEIDKITLNVIYNDTIQNSLCEDNNNYDTDQKIYKLLSMNTNDNIKSIIFISNKGKVYSSEVIPKQNIYNSKILEKIEPTYGNLEWSFNKDDINFDSNRYYIFAGRYVQHLELNVTPGMLIIKIDPKQIEKIFIDERLEKKGRYLLCNQLGQIVYDERDTENNGNYIKNQTIINSMKNNKKGSYIDEFKNSLITYNSHNRIGWSVMNIIPYDEVIFELKRLQKIIFLIISSSIFIAVVLAIMYSLSFTKPIKEIVEKMRCVRQGNFNVQVNTKRKDEIGKLSENFNKMSSEIIYLVEKLKKEQDELKKSEINSLIHQINPHFLYNTLDNINMLAKMSNETRISKLITALSKLLRISLSKGAELISIKDELEHVKNYLLIQKMRYGNLFDFSIDIQEDLLNIKVIKLILQPLAENAITHGFNSIFSEGIINIRVYQEKDDAILEVSNNGVMLSKEELELLNNNSYNKMSDKSKKYSGYGIYNINLRLSLCYGDKNKIIFSNNDQGGVTCKIKIPVNYSNSDNYKNYF